MTFCTEAGIATIITSMRLSKEVRAAMAGTSGGADALEAYAKLRASGLVSSGKSPGLYFLRMEHDPRIYKIGCSHSSVDKRIKSYNGFLKPREVMLLHRLPETSTRVAVREKGGTYG